MALLYTDLTVKINGVTIDDYFSFIWTDRFNTVGDFEMVLPFTKRNSDLCKIDGKTDVIVTCNLSTRAMLIENVIIQISPESGKQIKISGRSYESILDRRVVADNLVFTNDQYSSGKAYNAFSTILNKTFTSDTVRNIQVCNANNKFDPGSNSYKIGSSIPDYVWVYDPNSSAPLNSSERSDKLTFHTIDNNNQDIWNANINIDATGRSFLDILEEFCQAKGFGYKLLGNKIYMYAPRKNGNYIFSIENDNLVSAEYLVSTTDYKNVAFVEGDEYKKSTKVEQTVSEGQMLLVDPDTDGKAINYRVMVQRGSYSGLARREIYIKSSKNKGDNTNKKYCARLSAEGMYNLAKKSKFKKQASCEVMKNVYVDFYGKDFDIGDIVNVKLTGIYDPLDKTGTINGGIITDQMIIEQFTISHSESGLELYPVLTWYDPDQLKMSNLADSGFEEDYNYVDSVWHGKVKCVFMYNGGHHPTDGEVYRYNKNNNFKEDGTWYLYPENLNNLQVINTDSIMGMFNYQEKGDWMRTPKNPPIRDHYIFKGWQIQNGEIVEGYDSSKPEDEQEHLYPVGGPMFVMDNHMLYAQWEIEQIKITFDPGEGGFFSTGYTVNEEGKVEMMCDYGTMPNPPLPAAKRGYRYAYPNWEPTIVPATEEATYVFQWEQISENDDDPKGSNYNGNNPTHGVYNRGKKSTSESDDEINEESDSLGLVHFRSCGSIVDNGYNETGKKTSNGGDKAPHWYYERDIGNGYKMVAHWLDLNFIFPELDEYGKPKEFTGCLKTIQNETYQFPEIWFGISILDSNDNCIGLWRWSYSGGFNCLPELAFNTVPAYIPYYEKQTLQWGYEHGEIQMGLLHLAPVFVPFKYYRKIRINNQDTYWLLCVPPLNWLTNWGDYYYNHKAGDYVGFTCQFYDTQGDLIQPIWSSSFNGFTMSINGQDVWIPSQITYGRYRDGSTWKDGANTIYDPYSIRKYYVGSWDSVIVKFSQAWNTCGWQWRKIPNERWNAQSTYSPSSIDDAVNYEGSLFIDKGYDVNDMNYTDDQVYAGLYEQGGYKRSANITNGWGGSVYHDSGYPAYNYRRTPGNIWGPKFGGYNYFSFEIGYSSHHTRYSIPLYKIEDPRKGAISDDTKILCKQSGQDGLAASIIQNVTNVISKSNSLSYFTYQLWLPAVSKIKERRWYVSSDGQNWHLITGAKGNSLKIKTTDKTAAQNQAAGLTGADAIVGTNGSYYKSEVYYEDENGTEFKQTSDVGRLNIDDTDISGAGIEMDNLMNPDGTTNGIDIDDPSGTGNDAFTPPSIEVADSETINKVINKYKLAGGLSGARVDIKKIAEEVGLSTSFVQDIIDQKLYSGFN